MKKIESSDDIFEKRSECLDTLEKAMGERLFKFGTDSNIHASEEIKDWAIYHPSPTLCLNNEELKNGKMDICMACNLRRKVGVNYHVLLYLNMRLTTLHYRLHLTGNRGAK